MAIFFKAPQSLEVTKATRSSALGFQFDGLIENVHLGYPERKTPLCSFGLIRHLQVQCSLLCSEVTQ